MASGGANLVMQHESVSGRASGQRKQEHDRDTKMRPHKNRLLLLFLLSLLLL